MLAALNCASAARPTGGRALSVLVLAADFEAPAALNPCTQGILPMDAPGPGKKRGRVALYPRVAYPPIPSVSRPLGLKFGHRWVYADWASKWRGRRTRDNWVGCAVEALECYKPFLGTLLRGNVSIWPENLHKLPSLSNFNPPL